MTLSKRALFLWGGWEDHQPRETSERFAAALRRHGHDVTLAGDPSVLESPDLPAYDLIVVSMTMSGITDAQEKGLLDAVRTGTGLGGWHGGLADAFRDRTEYQFAVGGQWVAHPGNDTVDYTVTITAPADPIMDGIDDFRVRSEQYYLHIDPGIEILATTRFSGEHASWIDGVEMPVVWKKRYGAGRVFYCSLGHRDEVFDIPEASAIVERGLVWAAGEGSR